MTHKDTLRNILAQIEAEIRRGASSLVVFDIDSTLLDVSPRISVILREFERDHAMRELFPTQCDSLTKAEILKGDWGVEDVMTRLHPSCSDPQFLEELESYWRTRFFSNDYLKHDTPYPGAVEFCKKVYDLSAQIAYLTGRDQERMGEGTRESLKQHGLPLDDQRAQLVLKPDKAMPDPEFKRDWFSELDRTDLESLWFFENEPANIELLRHHDETVQIIFFDSTHSKKAPAPTDLPKVHHFLLD